MIFAFVAKKTPVALLKAFPAPQDLVDAPKAKVLRVLDRASRGHVGLEIYERLMAAARSTLGLPGAQRRLRDEIVLTLDRLTFFEGQIKALERDMVAALKEVPETPFLLSIPMVAPVTAAVFLGSIGDPRAYDAANQVLKVAGMSLIERSSGVLRGTKRLSKRGRSLLRQSAYMFAILSILKGGLFRAEYEALCQRNGGKKLKAVVAVMRSALRLFFSISRDRRMFTVEPPPRNRRRPLVDAA